jgi:hypothetical protein
MKLRSTAKIVTVNEKDLGMKGEKFSFTVKVLTFKESMSIMNQTTNDDGKEDVMQFAEEVFTQSVIAWDNIIGESYAEDGSDIEQILDCTDENKRIIFNFNPDFCKEVINKASEKISKDKKK